MNASTVFNLAVTALLMIPAIASAGHEGPGSSGGGLSVVCRDPQTKKVISARMLDLAEGADQSFRGYHLTIAETGDESASQATKTERAKKIVHEFLDAKVGVLPEFRKFIEAEIDRVRDRVVFIPRVSFIPTEDYGEIHLLALDEGCALEHVGVYGDGKLYVQTEIFSRMSSMQQAAFFVHEGVYKVYRDFGSPNSEPARLSTAQIFSTSALSRDFFALNFQTPKYVEERRKSYTYRCHADKQDPHFDTSDFQMEIQAKNLVRDDAFDAIMGMRTTHASVGIFTLNRYVACSARKLTQHHTAYVDCDLPSRVCRLRNISMGSYSYAVEKREYPLFFNEFSFDPVTGVARDFRRFDGEHVQCGVLSSR